VTHEPTQGKPIRVMPVLIMNRAGRVVVRLGEAGVDERHVVDVLRQVREDLETHVPHWPWRANSNGDFISGPTWFR
jgi:hypothetical protein